MLNYIFCDSLNFDYTFHIEYSCNCQPISGSGSAYFERSPINFVDKFSCPIILFQGLEDKVCTKLHLTFWFFFFVLEDDYGYHYGFSIGRLSPTQPESNLKKHELGLRNPNPSLGWGFTSLTQNLTHLYVWSFIMYFMLVWS